MLFPCSFVAVACMMYVRKAPFNLSAGIHSFMCIYRLYGAVCSLHCSFLPPAFNMHKKCWQAHQRKEGRETALNGEKAVGSKREKPMLRKDTSLQGVVIQQRDLDL